MERDNGSKMRGKGFAERLMLLRTLRNYTQYELGSFCGLPESLISHYERGAREPSLANFRRLCSGLGCTATDLLGI